MARAKRFDLLIKGGLVVTAEKVTPADVLLAGEKIAGVVYPGAADGLCRHTVDASGLCVFPGIIDSHVHLGFSGRSPGEEVQLGTLAAALGGITTVLEMPIPYPRGQAVDALEERKLAAAAHAMVDYGFHGPAGEEGIADIPRLAAAGVTGFHTVMAKAPPGRADETGLWCSDEGALWEVFRAVAGTGLPVAMHSESYAICARLQERLEAQGRRDGMAYAAAHPEVAEVAAAAGALALAEASKVSLHLCHTSVPRVMEMATAARERGTKVTLETCPQYLLATVDDLARLGPLAKCSPPLRSHSTVRALWTGVKEGRCDVIASGHTAEGSGARSPGPHDIWNATTGFPGLSTMLRLMLDAVAGGHLEMTDLARMLALRPAQIFGIYPQKGALQPGADADLVLIDVRPEGPVGPPAAALCAEGMARVYEGHSTAGAVVGTMVRGAWVVRDGKVKGRPGWGKPVAAWRGQ
ncbi:MAG TPA: hypothetical protein DCM14_01080 [Clostridiales bacterium UBA8153]|nr:hypothetical protein [Clostridiales bacterium UBA8153]